MQKRKNVPPVEVPTLLLTIEQVALALSVSRDQVYRYIRRNGLPTVKIDNGDMRISLTSLQHWIAEHEQAS